MWEIVDAAVRISSPMLLEATAWYAANGRNATEMRAFAGILRRQAPIRDRAGASAAMEDVDVALQNRAGRRGVLYAATTGDRLREMREAFGDHEIAWRVAQALASLSYALRNQAYTSGRSGAQSISQFLAFGTGRQASDVWAELTARDGRVERAEYAVRAVAEEVALDARLLTPAGRPLLAAAAEAAIARASDPGLPYGRGW